MLAAALVGGLTIGGGTLSAGTANADANGAPYIVYSMSYPPGFGEVVCFTRWSNGDVTRYKRTGPCG
jgi:hypothetical protein